MNKTKNIVKQEVIPEVERSQNKELLSLIGESHKELELELDKITPVNTVESKKNTIVNLNILKAVAKCLGEMKDVSNCIGTISINRYLVNESKEKISVKYNAKSKTVDERGFIERSNKEKTVAKHEFTAIEWDVFDDSKKFDIEDKDYIVMTTVNHDTDLVNSGRRDIYG